jgi:hypothetical protein
MNTHNVMPISRPNILATTTEAFGGLYFTPIIVRQCNCYIIIHRFLWGSNMSSIKTLEYRGETMRRRNELFISEFKTFLFIRTRESLHSLIRNKMIIPDIHDSKKYREIIIPQMYDNNKY